MWYILDIIILEISLLPTLRTGTTAFSSFAFYGTFLFLFIFSNPKRFFRRTLRGQRKVKPLHFSSRRHQLHPSLRPLQPTWQRLISIRTNYKSHVIPLFDSTPRPTNFSIKFLKRQVKKSKNFCMGSSGSCSTRTCIRFTICLMFNVWCLLKEEHYSCGKC